MTCDERYDSLLQYAMGTLGGPELDELRAHLNGGCPICAGKLAEANALLGILPLTLPSPALPPRVRQRLLDRIGPAKKPAAPLGDSTVKRHAVNHSHTWLAALFGALAAACITIVIYSDTIHAAQGKLLREAQERVRTTQNELNATANDARKLGHLIESPSVQIVTLKPKPIQAQGFARLILDSDNRILRVYATNLNPLPSGKGYELWLFNGGQHPIAAGTFQVNAQGAGSLQYTLPERPGQILQVAITDEPYNGGKGLTQPSGNIQFVQGLQ
ncbi:MAG TPA: anti-sigma factor [Tepidisphaeraceae bacterium]|jgi:hypothetical protein|nr:anti-sigma factor [Tepidisphaeraceae bacterium]